MGANYCDKHSDWRGWSDESCPHCYPPEIEQLEEAKDEIESLESKIEALQSELTEMKQELCAEQAEALRQHTRAEDLQAEVARLTADLKEQGSRTISYFDRNEKEKQFLSREIDRLREALENYGLPCAVWYFVGPYGPSPDEESPEKILEVLQNRPASPKASDAETPESARKSDSSEEA